MRMLVLARLYRKTQLTPTVQDIPDSSLVTWAEFPTFSVSLYSTLIQRLLLHLAIHHHKDSKQAFVPGSVLSSGRNSQLVSIGEETRHLNTWHKLNLIYQNHLLTLFFLLVWLTFVESSMFDRVRRRDRSGKQDIDENVLRVQLPLWMSCQLASCLQLRDELRAQLGGGQLEQVLSKTKITLTSRNLFLLLGKSSLSSHSWQRWFLKGRVMNSKAEQGVLQMYHKNCWVFMTHSRRELAKVAEQCWPFSFQQ